MLDPKPLVVIPAYLAEPTDVPVIADCLRSLRGTAGRTVDVLVVDDGSPNVAAVSQLVDLCRKYGAELHIKEENSGYSKTINIGLKRALDEGRHAITVNADIEFRHPGWVEKMAFQPNLHIGDGYAWVVGALLTFPTGLVQHAGVYFSLLTRSFDHLWKYAPESLPEVYHNRCCPVTGALQFIRHECLETVGLYDEEYSMAFEDVDYCLQVFTAGQECVFTPAVRAYHHESLFRDRGSKKVEEWTMQSLATLARKWKGQSFAGLVPAW